MPGSFGRGMCVVEIMAMGDEIVVGGSAHGYSDLMTSRSCELEHKRRPVPVHAVELTLKAAQESGY